MNLRRIIEQEVDKQEWGIELPNQVKLGDETLELTDRGVYQSDNTEVEYKVEDDKVLTSDDEELIPIEESEFDWTNDILDTISQEGDIPHFLYRDMNNIDPETNKPLSRDEGVVVDLTYWIEPTNETPEAYHVCWYEHITDNIESKVCTRFRATSIVRMFNDGEFIFI